MAKKYYSLKYLESFVGKEYFSKDYKLHLKIMRLCHDKFRKDTFDTQFYTQARGTEHALSLFGVNGAVNVEIIKKNFIEKNKVTRVLFDPKRTNKKRGD